MAIDPITGTPYEERINRAVSAAGTNAMNPEAVRQALAKETYANDAPLQEAQAGQQGAIAELAAADQKISQMFRNPQGQATQTFQTAAAPSAAFDPNNPQATIASGPMQVATDTTQQQAFAYNPFVEEGLKTGQTSAATGTFSLADMARSARERYLGNEIDQMVSLYKTKLEEEQRQREADEERKRLEQADKLAAFQRQQAYAEAMGGEVVDPVTGQTYKYLTPAEKAAQAEASKSTVLQGLATKKGRSGKSLIEEVTDGMGNFVDVLRENSGQLSQDEVYELARVNAQRFGAFAEEPDQLRQMGLSPEILDKLGIPRAGAGGGSSDVSGFVSMVKSGQMDISKVPADVRNLVANEVGKQGASAPQMSPEQQASRQEIFNLANEIPGKGTKGLTGSLRLGLLNPFSQDLKTQRAKIEQLKSKLQLLGASSMKGQGTMSDAERAILANAVSSLDYNQPDDAFRQELQNIATRFGGQSQSAPAGMIRVKDKASGQTGTIPANEFNPNAYERI